MYILKSNKRMLKLIGHVLLCLTMLVTLLGALTPFQSKAHAAGELKPFPQQVTYPGIIKPNHVTQASMNSAVSSYYDYWKGKYLKNDLVSLPGGYYVKGEITGDPEDYPPLGTSEGQGYGMVITALMAGYDSNAKTIYDGLFKTARAFKSSINPNLMGWIVADNSGAQGHYDSATDGDIDIAYSLILADRQWGSTGTINYLQEAKKMITNGIKVSNVTTNNRLNLGDWDGKSTYDTRPSDWMLSHFRAFHEVTGDQVWLDVINNLYTVYGQFSTSYSSSTGLISDFVINNPPQPAPSGFLEGDYDNEYNYNASRVPLRIVMDYAFYGDTRGRDIANKMAVWIKGKTSGVPGNIKDGYKLNGTARGSYATAVFVSPFISAATTNSAHQAWVNAGWDWMKNKKEGYFSDSYNLLNMLFISGNWWIPTAGGGTPTPDTQAPTAPTNLTTAVVSNSSINLSWIASTDNVGVTGYQISRNGAPVGTSTGTTFSDNGLTASTAYSYTVKAVDAAGNFSANSNTATATTNANPPTSVNLALGKTAVASSIEGTGFEASKATDGVLTTRWASNEGSNNEWIYVDLSATQSVYRVKLNWEDAYAKGYKIQVSNDKTTWTDAYTTTTGDGGIDDITFTAKSGRYVRVLGITRGTTYGYSLYEFEVYGS
ncbi:chemotaxis protein [Paenibacillus anaericanus]|uniref:Glucanase n=2 Tax=Paenibacillus TaxID=44249 RepID=A0A3S1C8W3_9BACL|nr:chemotaxis protein [Paenibacillus anaericanus]